jgi:hypothetical protein
LANLVIRSHRKRIIKERRDQVFFFQLFFPRTAGVIRQKRQASRAKDKPERLQHGHNKIQYSTKRFQQFKIVVSFWQSLAGQGQDLHKALLLGKITTEPHCQCTGFIVAVVPPFKEETET